MCIRMWYMPGRAYGRKKTRFQYSSLTLLKRKSNPIGNRTINLYIYIYRKGVCTLLCVWENNLLMAWNKYGMDATKITLAQHVEKSHYPEHVADRTRQADLLRRWNNLVGIGSQNYGTRQQCHQVLDGDVPFLTGQLDIRSVFRYPLHLTHTANKWPTESAKETTSWRHWQAPTGDSKRKLLMT